MDMVAVIADPTHEYVVAPAHLTHEATLPCKVTPNKTFESRSWLGSGDR